MTSITKMSLKTDPDLELEALKDSAATQRALDYYLKPAVSQQVNDKKVFLVRDDVSQEEAIVNVSELLRCAITTAQGAIENPQGAQRDLILCMVYFLESAKQLVDKVVDAHLLPTR